MVLGILLTPYLSMTIIAIALLLSLFVWIIWIMKRKSYAYAFLYGVVVMLFFFSLGSVRTMEENSNIINSDQFPDVICCRIVNVPVEKDKTIFLQVKVLMDSPRDVMLQLYVKKDDWSLSLQEGDWISVKKETLVNTRINTNSDYQGYLRSKGFSGSYYVKSVQWMFVAHSTSFSLKVLSHRIQKKLVSILEESGMSGLELGVVSALSIGDKSLLDKDLKNSYSVTGASHILAVSGLHVGVVFFVFSKILSLFMRSASLGKLRVLFSLVVLWIFTFVTGLSPSVIRAAIMLTLASLAILINRKSQIYNTVFAAAFFMLLYSPRYLFDVGFQLSFAAVLSILFFQKPIYNALVPRNIVQEKIWSVLSVTFAAQIGTLFFTLYYFHQVSNVFWLSCFVVIPVSSLVIYLSILLWCFHSVPFVGGGLSYVLTKIVYGMNCVVQGMEGWDWTVCQNVAFGKIDLLFGCLFLLLLVLVVKKQSFRRIMAFLMHVFLWSIYQTITIFFVS